jgi:arylsulfatase A-like enzyme
MLAYGPGFTGGKVVKDLVSLIDVAPTIVAAGGVSKPVSMRGRPLQELVGGKAKDWPEDVFVQISESGTGRAVRTKRWKYCIWAEGHATPASDEYAEQYLYDLGADPFERNNLVRDPKHAGVRKKLRALLLRRMTEIGEQKPRILPAPEAT